MNRAKIKQELFNIINKYTAPNSPREMSTEDLQRVENCRVMLLELTTRH